MQKDNEIVLKDWYCYLLQSENEKNTYVGSTVDPFKRIRQHNGFIQGGAKYTRKYRPWKVYCILYGFKSKNKCLSFEWYWKHQSRKQTGQPLQKRLKALEILLNQKQNSKLIVIDHL